MKSSRSDSIVRHHIGDLIILLQAWYNQPGNHFDMVYGHFAAMGGFAADVEHIHNITNRTTITPRGILLLARRGKFCQVNRSHIQDKSKADLLAKSLVCVQVLWVAGQAIERKLAGYPMTLLEIHTLVHVVCALVMYGLWLQKPLNVQDQTLVSFEEDQTTLAYMLQTSQSNFPSRYRGFNVQRPYYLARREECVMDILDVGEAQSLYVENIVEKSEGLPRLVTQAVIQEGNRELAQISTYFHLSSKGPDGTVHQYPMSLYLKTYRPACKDPILCTVFSGQALKFSRQSLSPKIGPELPRRKLTLDNEEYMQEPGKLKFLHRGKIFDANNVQLPALAVSLTRKDIRRLSNMSRWTSNPDDSLQIAHLINPFSRQYGDLLSISVPDWTAQGLLIVELSLELQYGFLSALALLPTAYGYVHYTTLGFLFPTTMERLLWKISCILFMASGGGAVFIFLPHYLDGVAARRLNKARLQRRHSTMTDIEGRVPWPQTPSYTPILSFFTALFHFLPRFLQYIVTFIVYLLAIFFCVLYCAARIYVVLESFISLRCVPIGVYQTPSGNFINYIPHL
jgi:hypothetical protein